MTRLRVYGMPSVNEDMVTLALDLRSDRPILAVVDLSGVSFPAVVTDMYELFRLAAEGGSSRSDNL
jgi:hypothetical protein